MLRRRAVRSLLVEEVAGLRTLLPDEARPPDDGGTADRDRSPPPSASPLAADRLEEEAAAEVEALAKAERRALGVVVLDWLALAVLFLFRDTAAPFLPFDGSIETVFTLGVLAVAVHSGFRLGQLEKYRAVSRAHEGLR